MITRVDYVQLLVDRLRLFVPEDSDEKSYFTELIYDRIAAGNQSTPMGPLGIIGTPAATEQIYGATLQALDYLDQPAELAARPEGIVGLANLAWENRPALPLQGGMLQPLTVGPWQHLAADVVLQQAQSVCRIDLCTNGVPYCQLGTGFVVGSDQDRLLIMTNTHVVDVATQLGWPSLPSLMLTCDFARDSVLGSGILLPLDNEYLTHPQHDLALLYLQNAHFSGTALPLALTLASHVINDDINQPIGVIGHPALDTQRDGFFPLHYGFGNAFGIKRFSPGLVRARATRPWYGKYPTVDAIFHDATTLGGNSGSCIIDMNKGHIIGLHFGGWPMPNQQVVRIDQQDYLANLFYENGAVPLWTLAQDTMLNKVNFVA